MKNHVKKESFKSEVLLEIFCENRINTALEYRIKNSEEYLKAEEESDSEYEKIKIQDFANNHILEFDRAISASNAFGAVYAREAYKQGLHDGISLVSEIISINKKNTNLGEMSEICNQFIKVLDKE